MGKTRDAIGLDGEVVNRRRTISGPVSELVAAARREQPTPAPFPSPAVQPEDAPLPENCSAPNPPSSPHPGSAGSSSENLPFADEGSLTIRRQGRGEGEGQVAVYIYMLVYRMRRAKAKCASMYYKSTVTLLCSVSSICLIHSSLSMFFDCLCKNCLLSRMYEFFR